jgi:hypothetical protein
MRLGVSNMNKTTRPIDTLQRPDGNDLQSNYSIHDVAEAYFRGRMDEMGLHTEQWGIDMRHDDENLIYDNKMDVRIWNTDGLIDLRGICDIKSKSSEDWLGIFNERHLVKYTRWADIFDVPCFVFFTIVNKDENEVGEQSFVVPIQPFDGYEKYVKHYQKSGPNADFYLDDTSTIAEDCFYVDRTFGADDHNQVVVIEEDHYKDWNWVQANLL